MKEGRHVSVVGCGSMSSVSVSPFAAYSPAQPPPQTPSPYTFSVASTRWSSRPPTQSVDLCLRLLSLVLSFSSALSLVALSSTNKNLGKHPELLYLFIANILTVLYASYQLFKIICDMAHRGIFISDMISDYITFILDQFAGYLLISASSVAIPVIQHMYTENSFQKATVVSVCMSFASFLVIAAAAILSGYKVCKRIMW